MQLTDPLSRSVPLGLACITAPGTCESFSLWSAAQGARRAKRLVRRVVRDLSGQMPGTLADCAGGAATSPAPTAALATETIQCASLPPSLLFSAPFQAGLVAQWIKTDRFERPVSVQGLENSNVMLETLHSRRTHSKLFCFDRSRDQLTRDFCPRRSRHVDHIPVLLDAAVAVSVEQLFDRAEHRDRTRAPRAI